jgi:putative hydrolases of HD superfamily
MKKIPEHLPDLLYELSAVDRIPRSGLVEFLFDNFESIGGHSYKVCIVAYFLATILDADLEKVQTMALFHDTTETRAGDSNWIQKKYINRDEQTALEDQYKDLPAKFTEKLLKTIAEYEERKSIESKIVKDADNIAYFITLKQLEVKGNLEAKKRLQYQTQNLDYFFLDESKTLLRSILATNPNEWTMAQHQNTMNKNIHNVKGSTN